MSEQRAERLARYAALLNRDGPDSAEAEKMLEEYVWDKEFVELALLSRELKAALAGREGRPPDPRALLLHLDAGGGDLFLWRAEDPDTGRPLWAADVGGEGFLGETPLECFARACAHFARLARGGRPGGA